MLPTAGDKKLKRSRALAIGARRRLVYLALAFGLAIACLGSRAASEGQKLRIAASPTAILVWIAQEQGLFRNEGLDVELTLFQSGLSSAEALIEGQADLSTTADAAFVTKSFLHDDLRILATISLSQTSKLIGRKDRGVFAPSDLAGKKVGVTLGSAGEFFLTRYLTLNGIPISSPLFVNLKPSQIAEGLLDGAIDAGLTWEPFIRNAETGLKANAAVLTSRIDHDFYFMLLGKSDWIAKNPRAVAACLRSLVEAERFAALYPDRAKDLLRKRFNYERDYVDYLWPMHSPHVSLPQGLLFVLERHADWQIRKGQSAAEAVPNFLERIDTGPLRQVRENAVGIVK
ncbi:MAG: ABC transporter substrate-binding protein [Rhodomicrobium sp.]|nr:ABC transporter substrate-binding protein [Rhodomicrobium sp.]